MSNKLKDLAHLIPNSTQVGEVNSPLDGISHDSRNIQKNYMFACVVGENYDGHDYAQQAVSNGASSLLVERQLNIGVPQLIVDNVRHEVGLVAASIYGFPSNELTLVGVTGTNGKSSTVQILADISEDFGRRAEVYGTLTGKRTTPEATDLQQSFRRSLDNGIKNIMMEVSSHALELGRVNGTSFDAAVFTNLTPEHLDFHETLEAYFQAKLKLFSLTKLRVVNEDDEYGKRIISMHPDSVSYSLKDAKDLVVSEFGSTFKWHSHEIKLNLVGTHNVYNALAAATVSLELGVDESVIISALNRTMPVNGRFEIISKEYKLPFTVAVDYAHTPDAINAVIKAAREISKSRVIIVFGCGGDRDQHKRAPMGSIVNEKADLGILTTDNSRSEDPKKIENDVLEGITDISKVISIPDRKEAIKFAISEAGEGDVVVIAGKGHEKGQIIGSKVYPFDDIAVTREILEGI